MWKFVARKRRLIIIVVLALLVAFFCNLTLTNIWEKLGRQFACVNMWPRVSGTTVHGRTEDGKISVTSFFVVGGALGYDHLLEGITIPRAYATGGGFLKHEGTTRVVSRTVNAVDFEVPRPGLWYLNVVFYHPSYNENWPPCESSFQEFEVYVRE